MCVFSSLVHPSKYVTLYLLRHHNSNPTLLTVCIYGVTLRSLHATHFRVWVQDHSHCLCSRNEPAHWRPTYSGLAIWSGLVGLQGGGGGVHRLRVYESMEEKLVVSLSGSLGGVSVSLGNPVEPDRGLLSLAEEFSVEQVAGCELASVLQDIILQHNTSTGTRCFYATSQSISQCPIYTPPFCQR